MSSKSNNVGGKTSTVGNDYTTCGTARLGRGVDQCQGSRSTNRPNCIHGVRHVAVDCGQEGGE